MNAPRVRTSPTRREMHRAALGLRARAAITAPAKRARRVSRLGLVAVASSLALGAITVPPVAGQLETPANSPASGPVSRTGYITVAGGFKLAYDLTLPAAHGRFPVAFEYDHYSVGADNDAENPNSDAGHLLMAGFAVLGVNEPGSGCSGGVNDPADVNEWGPAGAQAVEWAASQPWSTGHVGMFGSSWTAITQVRVASFRPKGLDAITPFNFATHLYRDIAYPGGVFNASFLTAYEAKLVKIAARTAKPSIASGDRQCISDAGSYIPANKKYDIATNAAANPFYDGYYQTGPDERISRIDVPVLGCEACRDGLVSSRATEIFYDTLDKATSWFIGMNGQHGICETPGPLAMMVDFMRHFVAGASTWGHEPHIRLLHDVISTPKQLPTPTWTSTYESWSEVMKPVALYLGRGGSLQAGPPSATTAGRATFAGPTASQSGHWAKAPAPGSYVSYTSPPLLHDVDIFGPASVNLWLSSTARDADIEVIVSEVRPGGEDQYVQSGWLNVAQRKQAPAGNKADQSSVLRPYQLATKAAYEPLAPGRPVYARVEVFPFEHVFRKGSSIQLTIDSASGPVQSTGLWGLTAPSQPFRDTIYASSSQPSELVLGTIPGAVAKAPLPTCGTVAGEPCRPGPTRVPPGALTFS
jgi:predicted acyl esterase